MTCKICHKNETDNTSGICGQCSQGYYEIQKGIEVKVRRPFRDFTEVIQMPKFEIKFIQET